MMGSHVRLSIFERLRFRAGRLAVPGAGNALVRKSLVRDLHGFRPLRYGEDLDFFRRAEQRGARLAVCPTATIEHLISPDRLEPGYLYSTARRAGATQATIDKGGGWWIRYVVALLRLAHMSTITLPSLAWHLVRRDKSQIVSKRSSLHFAAGYILNVLGGQASVPQITVRGETP
jgi:GT2 family glycosyltransferase